MIQNNQKSALNHQKGGARGDLVGRQVMTIEWPVGACQVMTNMGVKGAKAAWSMPVIGSQRLLVAIARRRRRRTTTTKTDSDHGNRLSQGMAACQSLTAFAERRPDQCTSKIERLKAQKAEWVDDLAEGAIF